MTQPFADALTWVPKSRALGATLAQANDLARARGHGSVTLEHLLQSLIEDPDAEPVLEACQLDLVLLGQDIAEHLKTLATSDVAMPVADPDLLRILEYAVAAAQQSKRREVNGAIVLAAIVGEGKSTAAELLQKRGLTFQDTVRALQRGGGQRVPATPPPAPTAVPEDAEPRPPATRPPIPSAPLRQAPAHLMPDVDEDPVLTARRRIEAARTGQLLPPAPALPKVRPRAGSAGSTMTAASEDVGEDHSSGDGSVAHDPDANVAGDVDQALPAGWAPPPLRPQSGLRVPRMPPPMPPLPPTGHNGHAQSASASSRTRASATTAGQLDAPWSDASAANASAQLYRPPVVGQPLAARGQPFDLEDLLQRLPERLRLGRTVTIEIAIPRAALPSIAPSIAAQAQAQTQAHAGVGGWTSDPVIQAAISVRLKSLTRGMHVEPLTAETQWLDNRLDPMIDDQALWRWAVTPATRGTARLQLVIASRNAGPDVFGAETALPAETVEIRVGGNAVATARRWAGWTLAALVGAVLYRVLGATVWNEAVTLIALARQLAGQ